MSGYQVVLRISEREWDSIRDSDREALFKVAEYMRKDYDSKIVDIGRMIQSKLIFGVHVKNIADDLELDITVKYIP